MGAIKTDRERPPDTAVNKQWTLRSPVKILFHALVRTVINRASCDGTRLGAAVREGVVTTLGVVEVPPYVPS